MTQGKMAGAARERLMANDAGAYAAQQIANIDWGTPESAVRQMTVRTLVYSGTEDEYPLPGNHEMSKQSAVLAPNATFVALEGHDHTTAFQESAIVIPYVRAFLGLA
jgi:pimeloyl-ACP methyl ester carboxylesterase